MSFFNQSEQQRLMAQMFGSGAPGMTPFQTPQGQGGIGQNAPQIGPSFVGPGDEMGGGGAMPNDLGVEAPDNFNLPVPNIGDQAMVQQPPNIGDQAMVRGQVPRMDFDNSIMTPEQLQALGGPGGGLEKLIQAILNRQSVY